MTDWVVVPVKSIANGKSRLAPILSRPRRQRLNRDLLAHTLEVASEIVGRRQVVVVSQCLETQEIAKSYGAWALREPRGMGLNRALGLARDHAVWRGATGVLVLPSDLPLASPADLRHILHAGKHARSLVMCRDRHGHGTNALYLRRPSKFRFRFGENSAAAHSDEAARRGLSEICLDVSALGFDLDTPNDYRDLGIMAPRANANLAHGFIKILH